jgi:hypothetical protein
MTLPECTCPTARFDAYGDIETLPQGTNPDCTHCHPNPLRAAWGQQCTAERPFGPCTKRCEQPTGHEGMHRSQCVVWDDTSWTQYDQTGETIAAVSYAEKIDLGAQPYTGPITDDQYRELFLRGEFYVVKPTEENQP